jgi:hypothetical protein
MFWGDTCFTKTGHTTGHSRGKRCHFWLKICSEVPSSPFRRLLGHELLVLRPAILGSRLRSLRLNRETVVQPTKLWTRRDAIVGGNAEARLPTSLDSECIVLDSDPIDRCLAFLLGINHPARRLQRRRSRHRWRAGGGDLDLNELNIRRACEPQEALVRVRRLWGVRQGTSPGTPALSCGPQCPGETGSPRSVSGRLRPGETS